MKNVIFALVSMILTIPCYGRIITVDNDGPADFATIQAAIDDANDGDIVIVFPGTYTGDGNRDIDFLGKAITVRSTDPYDFAVVNSTIINCSGEHRGFYFHSGEDKNSVLAGLVIRNGYSGRGGAILCDGSSPAISNCIMVANSASNGGGGLYCSAASGPKIVNCVLAENSAIDGGAVYNCGDVSVISCSIYGNIARIQCGGVYNQAYTRVTMKNCILWGNEDYEGVDQAAHIHVYPDDMEYSIDYCCIQGWDNSLNGTGNIGVDPSLVPGGYHLSRNSACIDSGDPQFYDGKVRDLDGDVRIIGSGSDIGADEFNPENSVIGIEPTSFYFRSAAEGTNPQPQDLSIENGGLIALNWRIELDCSWLNVSVSSGESLDQPNEVAVGADTSGLEVGTYQGMVRILDDAASNSPMVIPVTLVVTDNDGVLNVPSEYETIQSAINLAVDGECVVLAEGTYTGVGNRDIFLNKGITVRSTDPNDPNIVAATIIDCQGSQEEPHIGFHITGGAPDGPTLAGVTVTNGYTGVHQAYEGKGGGIQCYAGEAVISNCVISKNCSTYGGGIYCEWSSAEITNCQIIGNSSALGGGIYCDYGRPVITNCLIAGNIATWLRALGGGIYRTGGGTTMRITNCTVSRNSASGDVARGGGIYCESYSQVSISDSTIVGNSVHGRRDDGGGVYCAYGHVAITGSNIVGNSSFEGNGGGIYCEDGNIVAEGCVIIGNCSIQGAGGGLYALGGRANLTNCTVVSNMAPQGRGGGIYCHDSSQNDFSNCIIWGNSDRFASDETAQVNGGKAKVSFSCIQDDNPGDVDIPFDDEDNGNIDDDPMFVRNPDDGGDGWGDDPETEDVDEGANDDFGDVHLQKSSPCINVGSPYGWVDPNAVDMDGEARVMGGRLDIGADEYFISMITVTKPAGGEVWAAGSRHEIGWETDVFKANVDILFSSDAGQNWETIAGGVGDTGRYVWQLPEGVDSNSCMVSVVPSVADANVVATSSGLFSIRPDSPGEPVEAKWKTLGGGFDRRGLSGSSGPELGCVKWQFEIPGAVSASVTIGKDDRVHVACEDGKLYALNGGDGSVLWSYDANSPLVSAPSIGPDGTLYVGAKNGKLYAVDVDGNLRWTHTTAAPVSSAPAVSADGKVYAGSEDGTLYALDRDGSELWTFTTRGVGLVPAGAIFASPAIGPDGAVYVGAVYEPNLYCLDAADGSVKWTCSFTHPIDPCDPNSPTESGWPVASPVVAEDGTIYQTLAYDPNLYAINPGNGEIIWSSELTPQPDTLCGSVRWDLDLDYYDQLCENWFGLAPHEYLRYRNVRGSGLCEPALGPDGTIYVGLDTDPYLRAVNPDGTIRWVTRLGMVGGFSLTVGGDGLIYAANDEDGFYVVSPAGEELARFESEDWLILPVITGDGTIVLADSEDSSMLVTGENKLVAVSRDACGEGGPDLHRPQDLDADGVVNFTDLALVAADWLECTDPYEYEFYHEEHCWTYGTTYYPGDADRDLYVDFADFAVIANRWLIED